MPNRRSTDTTRPTARPRDDWPEIESTETQADRTADLIERWLTESRRRFYAAAD